jgi:hypothetical protein
VSADWIGQASGIQVKDAVAPLDYGYLWWSGQVARTEHRFYAAMGMMGQNIWVVPDLDLIVVTTNDLSNDGQAIISAIAKAAVSDQPLPPNPSALKTLQARVDELAHPQASSVKPIPDAAKVSSGKVYQLEPNDFGWKSISIDFAKPDEALFMIGLPDKVLKLPVGMDTVYRVSTEGLPAESVWRPIANVPQMVRAGFLGKRLMIYMADCMGMEFWTLTVDFSKDGSKLWVSAVALNDTSATFSMSHDLIGTS